MWDWKNNNNNNKLWMIEYKNKIQKVRYWFVFGKKSFIKRFQPFISVSMRVRKLLLVVRIRKLLIQQTYHQTNATPSYSFLKVFIAFPTTIVVLLTRSNQLHFLYCTATNCSTHDLTLIPFWTSYSTTSNFNGPMDDTLLHFKPKRGYSFSL